VEETIEMATGPRYRVAFRRRREGKTDYQQRRGLVISGLPRLVVRGSLRNVAIQIIKAQLNGDVILAAAYSDELAKKYGWLGDTGNLPAAYLTGLLCGFKAVRQGVNQAVFDVGLHRPSKGSRVFAALKGTLDAGLSVTCDKEKLPDEKRITGQHIVEYAKHLSSNPEAYQKRFSAQLAKGLKPEEINTHFVQVKERVISSWKKVEPLKMEKEEVSSSTEEFEEITEKQKSTEEE
jgi:large subunit ribosomal protein L18